MENCLNKKVVVVLFGGMSPEHDISCLSAASILKNIDRKKYEVIKIGITKDGRWLMTNVEPELIARGKWNSEFTTRPAIISPDRSVHGIISNKIPTRVDCVFPIIHGKSGEDGQIQGLLELAGIPYVGPGVQASACSMDKGVTKKIVAGIGIKQAKHCETSTFKFAKNPVEELKKISEAFNGEYPLFVKPSSTGSSVGISKVRNDKELFEGMRKAAACDPKIIIEKAIVGRELEVAVLGNNYPQASLIGEILPAAEFYDFDAKYNNSDTKTRVATDLPEAIVEELQQKAIAIYKELGCKGLSRVDFFLSNDGEVIFNEINTMPGFTSISMYPQLWAAAGLEYSDLIDRLIDLAMENEDED